MDQLLDFLFELAKNWRIFVSTVVCTLLGIVLASQRPSIGAYLFTGGLGIGLAIGIFWQSKQATFNV
jgi:ABC-type dipeptide/oligopeptide/nickel transport system permease component